LRIPIALAAAKNGRMDAFLLLKCGKSCYKMAGSGKVKLGIEEMLRIISAFHTYDIDLQVTSQPRLWKPFTSSIRHTLLAMFGGTN